MARSVWSWLPFSADDLVKVFDPETFNSFTKPHEFWVPLLLLHHGLRVSYYRTPEHRARQSVAIRRWRPWEKSTGPKSAVGKATVARNAYRGRWRVLLRDLREALGEQDKSLNARNI